MARTLEERLHASHIAGVGTELPLDRHPMVFEPFPATELHEFPALLARALPPLPRPLEYRLIGNDLVLRDADGDVIVAVLRDAVGGVTTTSNASDGGSCEVYPNRRNVHGVCVPSVADGGARAPHSR